MIFHRNSLHLFLFEAGELRGRPGRLLQGHLPKHAGPRAGSPGDRPQREGLHTIKFLRLKSS